MAGYPFKPLQDHLFGEALGLTWVKFGDLTELDRAISFYLKGTHEHFIFSSKGDKQVFMNLYPTRFRKYLSEKDYPGLKAEFQALLNQDIPRLDIALDLLEWIFTGFDEDELVLALLLIITNNQISFPKDFLLQLKSCYNTL